MINLSDIAPSFLFLASKGMVLGPTSYSPEDFGNANLIMIGDPFSLRFERDRGQVFVDVGNIADGWHKLEDALEFLDNKVDQQQLGYPPDAAILALELQSHWDAMVSLFSAPRELGRLREFSKIKSTTLLNCIFGKH